MPCEGGAAVSGPQIQLNGDQKRHIRVVILGGAKVGKTSIIWQFLYDKAVINYKPTVEELHRGEYELEGETLILDILDTSGSHSFPAMRELAIKQSDAVMLVYAIDDVYSWEMVRFFRDEVLRVRGDKIPIIVVGNKCDLEQERRVSKLMAETIVCFDWDYAWLETSAFSSNDVLDIFKEVLIQGKIRYRLSPAVEKRRKSLPAYSQAEKHQQFFLKRHSCNVS